MNEFLIGQRTDLATSKISIRGLAKSYGATKALLSTDIEVNNGEFLTLLGPSGSGKTTLLSLIAGLIKPDSGTIRIDGRDITHAAPEARDLGMVFQNYALFPHMTVAQNIGYPLRMRGLPRAETERRVQKSLAAVQLEHFGGRKPIQLSGGQQQRVALARCMVYEPSVILMDEPLGALDKKLREHMQLEIKRLHKQLGITILYVTHDQEEALVMSDRICLMNDARIEQLATPDELYFRPRSRFAADFLGESNLFSVKLAGTSSNGHRLVGPNGLSWSAAHLVPSARTEATAVVRPESIAILGERDRADNELTAIVSDCVIAGAMTKLYMTVPGDVSVLAAMPTRRERPMPARGEALRLGWAAEATVVVPSETTEA